MKLTENKEQTIRNILLDLNQIKKNNELYYKNFLKFSLTRKPPFLGSYLVHDSDDNRYLFWYPNNFEKTNMRNTTIKRYKGEHKVSIKEGEFTYYPLGRMTDIVLLYDVTFINNLYNHCIKSSFERSELIEIYGAKLHAYITKLCIKEIELFQDILSTLSKTTNNKLF